MRTLEPRKRESGRRPLASAAFAAIVLFSGAAFAECTGTAGVNIQASAGETCFASGNYVSTGVIAGQATGVGSVLTNDGDGPSSVSFSTSSANTPAVQADTGGSVTLVVAPPSTIGTVTTTGSGSIGLYATGSSEDVASSIVIQNFNVSTQGNNANAVQADSGGFVSVTGGSAVTSGIDAFGMRAASGATAMLSGGSFQTGGTAAVGIVVTGATTTLTASGTSITTSGGVDSSGNAAEGLYNGPSTTDAAGGTVTLTNSTIAASGAGSGGIVEESGSITMTGGSIDTTGGNATGILNIGGYLGATGGTITLNNVTLTTTGANSFGLQTNDQGVTNLN